MNARQSLLSYFREHSKIRLAQTLMHLEGISLDYVATKNLITTRRTMDAFEINEVDSIILRNVVDGLNFLEEIDFQSVTIDIDLYINLNTILAREQALFTGNLRTGFVNIDCIPEDIPPARVEDVFECVNRLNYIDENTFRNIIPEVFCRLSRMQPFWDGNKRTTSFLCNIALIKNDLGIFIIKDELQAERFVDLLRNFYTCEDSSIFTYIADELIITRQELELEESKIHQKFLCGLRPPPSGGKEELTRRRSR